MNLIFSLVPASTIEANFLTDLGNKVVTTRNDLLVLESLVARAGVNGAWVKFYHSLAADRISLFEIMQFARV